MNDNIIGHKYDNAIRFLKRKLNFQSQDVSFSHLIHNREQNHRSKAYIF